MTKCRLSVALFIKPATAIIATVTAAAGVGRLLQACNSFPPFRESLLQPYDAFPLPVGAPAYPSGGGRESVWLCDMFI